MKHPTLTLRRADLVAANACAEWLGIFDAICAMRGLETAPIVRRGQIWRRDPQRLRIELTPLAQLWMARDAHGAVSWLRDRGVLGPVYAPRVQASGIDLRGAYLGGAYLRGAYLRGAYLRGAYLGGADLSGADLRGADLSGADLRSADLYGANLRSADLRSADLSGADLRGAYLSGADLSGADLRGAYLRGADLRSADLSGAWRWSDDPAVPGWTLRDGVLCREVVS